jgi:hypothetical protein
MGKLSTRTLQTALWRTGARGGPSSFDISSRSLFWSNDEAARDLSAWRQVPSGIVTIGLPDASMFDLDAEAAPEISRLLDRGGDAPLGHDLLREAWNIHEANPRSALVIAVSAIEVGLKHFITEQLPQTEWLLHNMPSPPIHKLVRDFLPTVPSGASNGGLVPPLDSALVRVVHEAVERRNSLVHAGAASIPEEWLLMLFHQARRLLYQLDYHRGHEWALAMQENVQPWGRDWFDKEAARH